MTLHCTASFASSPFLSPSSACTYFNAVVGFLVYHRNVCPIELFYNLNHCLSLVRIRRNGSQEVLEALLVAQLGTRREEAHLRDEMK